MAAVYRVSMKALDKVVPAKLQPMWNHPAGPKTVFFWAPLCKWGLVIAGIGDISRPVEKLSLFQTVSLACTGLVWSRYSMVIIPKNYSLFSVNVFVCLTQVLQLARILNHERQVRAEKAAAIEN